MCGFVTGDVDVGRGGAIELLLLLLLPLCLRLPPR
jgi:hypothetical protein